MYMETSIIPKPEKLPQKEKSTEHYHKYRQKSPQQNTGTLQNKRQVFLPQTRRKHLHKIYLIKDYYLKDTKNSTIINNMIRNGQRSEDILPKTEHRCQISI